MNKIKLVDYVKWIATIIQLIGYGMTGLNMTPYNVYLFFWNDNSQNNLGLDASPIPSGAVSKEIYNKYDVGDTYCLEELML